jgi:membrane-associated phospholipid phosphatase
LLAPPNLNPGRSLTSATDGRLANDRWKVGVPAYVLASGIGLSRVESNRHNLSDVLAGATIGLIVGRTVARLDGQPAPRKRLVSVGPATDLNGQGIGIGVSASW